ncbi:SpoIIE family protein phosphatase [Pelodictyon phaeoclathratiforme]|jgi:PAS domain S-box-containing protein|uniref:Putative PAS/PAC sensor protein n=1 Tax=Pelodictyon phaeoclathratiforme (strain DSM 5477 / BU-1) TaxID=324925 RepID=B4SFQ0_PELPB|nr:SpoIIE family protein phosphatase [Pelodictyon phaeoclathratiforme]ACF43305.1 putative PAS/PAC sensor protein [Pelodictyon phaeoclathratiforme BU-1]MBV5290345.1 SpoIIE family protein phosphatase [Pelodictyon phaeoclathratiforme]
MKDLSEIAILFVDDEQDTLGSLSRFLRKEPYIKHFTTSGKEALQLLETHDIQILLTDLRMPEMSGMELINRIKISHPDIVRVILSGIHDIDQIIESINTGEVFRFIPKPIEPQGFKKIITDAIDYYQLKTEREMLFDQLETKNKELSKANDARCVMSAELRQSEAQFRTMNDSAFDPIFLLNEQGFIVYVNLAAETIFGITERAFHLKKFTDIISPQPDSCSLYNACKKPFQNLASLRNGNVRQIEGIKKDGGTIPLEVTTGTVMLDSVHHTVIIARDISSRIEEEKSRVRYEHMQQELEAQIEQKLLQSTIPNSLDGALMGQFTVSSGHLNGDFAEFILYDNKHADIIIGDVMGHGILSALVGAGLKTLFLKTVAQQKHQRHKLPELQDIVTNVHKQCILELLEIGIYATLLFIRLDLENMEFSMIDCGHTPSIHFHADEGVCTLLKGENLPVGMIEKQEYQTITFPLEQDDILVMYSDGITESLLPDNTLFGTERLSDLIAQYHKLQPEALVEKISNHVFELTGRRTFDDDATCIVIRIGSLKSSMKFAPDERKIESGTLVG